MPHQTSQTNISPNEYFEKSLALCKKTIYEAHDKQKKVKKIKINFLFRNLSEDRIAETTISFSRLDTTIDNGITDILNCLTIGLHKEPSLKQKYISCTIELN